MNKKVNLFVVGAMKAGTTSFTQMLAQHPDIYFSPVKEPHYFVNNLPLSMYSPSRFFSLENYLDNEFPKPLHITNIKTEEQYEKIFSLAPNDIKYLTEGSTGYLHAPESANLIYTYNPNAKVIILTRAPLKRAFSHYQMDVGLGRETKEFEDVIKREISAYKNNKLSPWSYLGMSLYKENIERYKKLFKDNVLVIELKEYLQNKDDFLIKLSTFLEIENVDLNLENKNQSRSIKNKRLQKFLFESGIRDITRQIIPSAIRQNIFKQLSTEKKEINLNQETIDELNQIFNIDYSF